uniref:Nitric oxide synthase n=1 Tax=Phallusia mammillata TaxID=59560 RepID=A0A6F9DN53_9ASCI|nr:nitric oxide synthase, brain-like [Phallusia mammillata]
MVRESTYNILPNIISVVLVKRKSNGLGFLVKERRTKPCVVVSEIVKGGSAYETGLINVGDAVLSINQVDLTNLPYREALQQLRNVPAGSKAVLLVQGPDGYTTHLQTTFTQNNKPRTVRVTEKTSSAVAGQRTRVPFSADVTKQQPTLGSSREDVVIKRNENMPKKKGIVKPINGVVSPSNQGWSKAPLNEVAEETKMNGKMNGCPVSNASKFTMVKNWETDKVQRDTLFAKACPVNTCAPQQCKGSVMTPSHMLLDPTKDKKTPAEIKVLAESFIEQYYDSMKRGGSPAHKGRLNEVLTSIDKTGTYELTTNELIFGAKTAWRNAPRCVGRIQWNKLQVYDMRHVTTAAEMFEAIVTHIKFATNKGNIRSCITFFPPRTDVSTEFRVWNNQLIRYAGYRQPDGSIIGDPANADFTQILERLGWKGKGGRFDLLPLLLQANGQDPELFELPPDLILEVQLRHPRFEWFKDLEFKWYAVPAVANIGLDIGGVFFPASPFNGWFMGTEIARDLCDLQRYNVLPEVAKKMGLDIRKTSSLWKDVALLEMNISVLYSFQTDNITIMDHHTASESFMKFFTNEMRLRGGCPGDWVWLVPPISGSATPVFHQEIVNYMLNPACLYQPDPWKYYKWKNNEQFGKAKKKINFRELAKSVLLTSTMMTKAMASRIKASIVYGTETGKSYDYAKTLQEMFNHAFDAKLYAMDEFEMWKMEYETLVLVVTSTFGNGDPPGNAETFAESLHKLSNENKNTDGTKPDVPWKRFKSVPTCTPTDRRSSAKRSKLTSRDSFSTERQGPLANVKFSVFGLGSRAYPNFCAFAHAMDSLFGEMEGERLLEIGEGDELSGQEESFQNWAKEVYKTACDTFCVTGDGTDMSQASSSLAVPPYEKSLFRVTVQPYDKDEQEYIDVLAKLHRKKLSPCKIKRRTNLQSKTSSRSTIKVELDSDNSKYLQFKPGDHLGIYPCNDQKLVKELVMRLKDAPEEHTLIQLEFSKKVQNKNGVSGDTWVSDIRLPPCTMWTAFSRFLDITTPPTPKLLRLLADCAVNEKEKEQLELLAEGKSEYEDWKFQKVPNLVEVLEEFQSIQVEPPLLLSQLPLLQCRYYSISSSPAVHPGEIHCTVAVVNYHTQGGKGPLHHGVCSTYLDNADSDEVIPAFIRPAPAFHLPEDESLPCMLVGPGTGIAPFRSFWQQRIHDTTPANKNKRTMALLFGCRHPDQDHLYKEEVEKAKKIGALTSAHTAFSRLPGVPKKYVQDVLRDEISDFVYDCIITKRGHFYVCGDVTMSADVSKALINVIKEKGNMSLKEATTYVERMKTEERYHEDIFGITLRTYEVSESIRKANRSGSINGN